MIFWIIFYIITAVIIGIFFVNEKFLTKKIEKTADMFSKLFDKVKIDSKKILYTINILSAVILAIIYVLYMDKTKSDVIPIKIYALNLTILLNVVMLALNYKKAYLFILDLVMYVAGNLIFGIEDMVFYNSLIFILIITFISIILEKEKTVNEIRVIFNGIFLFALITVIQNFYLGNYVIPTESMQPTILVGDRIFSNNVRYKFFDVKLNDMISFSEPLERKYLYTKRITGVSGTTFEIKDNIVYSNDKKISDRYYSDGRDSIYTLLGAGKYYIPKKGDEVKIKYLLELDVEKNEISRYSNEENLLEIVKDKDYKNSFGIYNSSASKYKYSYILEAKGHEDLLLPILEFKYNDKKMNDLLSGKYITLKDDYYMAMGDNTNNSQDSRYFGYISKKDLKGRLFFRWYPLNRIGLLKNE